MNKGFLIGIFAISSITASAQTEILNENFESGAPVAFTIVDNDGLTPNAATAQFTEAWTRMADPQNTTDTVMGSTSYFEPVGTASRWLITPALALGTYGNLIYWNARSHDPSYPDNYIVLLSTTDTQISSFTDTIGFIQEEYATWYQRVINLSANGFNNQQVYVAFVNNTNDGFALYIDDVQVVIDDPLNIDELAEIAVRVYPNPAADVLKIKSESAVELVEVIALNGAQILSTTESEINVSSLQNGSYFVKIVTDKGTVVRSFVKN
jgi:hypothetical protein